MDGLPRRRFNSDAVQAIAGEGRSVSYHPDGPKWTVQCGSCGYAWCRRIPKVDYPRFPCPHCHILNEMPVVWRPE